MNQGFEFLTATSYDFNPSITANDADRAFLGWSATDPTAGHNAMVIATSKLVSAIAWDVPIVLFTSPTFYLSGRWGDYASVQIDPRNSNRAWVCNEQIDGNFFWSTRIAYVGY